MSDKTPDDESDPSTDEPATPAAAPDPAPKPVEPDVWDRAGAWIVKYGPLPALAVITIAVLAIHFHIFSGETAGDDLSFHFAEARRLADCLRAGDFDFWNPSANAGYASAYYYQVVPQLMSAIPAAIFGHLLFWFQLSVILPLVLAPACAYRGMRLLGATPWQAVLAAFCVAFMNGESRWGAGNAGTFQVGLYTQTWSLCFFPLALGYGARWISEGKGFAPAVLWGAWVGLTHPFMVIVLGLAFTVGLVAPLVPRLNKLAWPSIVGRAAIVLGLLLMLVVPPWLAHVRPGWPPPRVGATYAWCTLGGLLILGGLALPVLIRPPGVEWEMPDWARLGREAKRWLVLGLLMIVGFMPVWVPLLADYSGFGGFPHRVGDEVGPGFYGLAWWYGHGQILDYAPAAIGRFHTLTLVVPVLFLFVRSKLLRWMWPAALFYALLLGMGPHMGKIGDDLFPAVRALGTMQTLLALGIGIGVLALGKTLWDAPWDRWMPAWVRKLAGEAPSPDGPSPTTYAMRTGLAAVAAGLLVLVAVPGTRALSARVVVFTDLPHNNRNEMRAINQKLAMLPPARKQVAGPGVVSHWWNLLSYVYYRVPSLLQMGGGGLQASPNYDFLWSERNITKNAWLYDAPYLVFARAYGANMPRGDTLMRTAHYELRRLPSAGLVSPVQVTGVLPPGARTGESGHTAALKWIQTDEPMKDHVLAYAGSGPAGPPPAGKTLRSWRQPSPGDAPDIVAEVQDDAPTTFLVRESWHPRWRAYIDGNPARVRRVTPDFPAVDVPAGHHILEMRFERPWWTLAVWLMWPGAALAAWLATRKRRKRQTASPLPEAKALG